MSFFSVAPMSGSYRATLHPYKFFFQMKTKVQRFKTSEFPSPPLSLVKCGDISKHVAESDYLVDVIGLLNGVSIEKEYVRDGKVTKMVICELKDESGKCGLALFGDYVDQLTKLVNDAANAAPVLVVHFAKIKIFRDTASIQNVMNTTKISVNPDIPEAVSLKNSLALHGDESITSVLILTSRLCLLFCDL